MTEPVVIGVLSAAIALVSAFLGGWAQSHFLSRAEGSRRLESGRFQVYMLLLDLHGHHFWLVSAEAQGQEPNREQLERFHSTAWRIADELRKYPLPEVADILEVLFGMPFPTEAARAEALDRVIDRLAVQANPIMRRLFEI